MEDKHIMPFLLIPVGTVVNNLGIYSKYIISGAYICKLFDYAQQCSPTENSRRQCTDNYTHIGYRYNNLFPFKKEEEEQISKKRRVGGTTKKGNQNKRKTRKQTQKRREGQKRRTKNKNKNNSKKYGIRFM